MSQPCSVAELIDTSEALARSGNIGAAFQRALEALEEARASGDGEAIAGALLCSVMVQFRLGHYSDARSLAEEALTYTGADPRHPIEALLMLGMCATETSDLAAGEDFYRRALDLSRQFGQDRLLQRTVVNLSAGVYIPRGQFDLALAADEEALDACGRVLALESWQEQAVLLGMRACLGLNDRARARRLYRDLEKNLRKDLNTEPQEEIQALYRSLTPTARTKLRT